jgi:hypothetical protein
MMSRELAILPATKDKAEGCAELSLRHRSGQALSDAFEASALRGRYPLPPNFYKVLITKTIVWGYSAKIFILNTL